MRAVATGFPSGAAVVPDRGRWVVLTPAGLPLRDGRDGAEKRFRSHDAAARVAEVVATTEVRRVAG